MQIIWKLSLLRETLELTYNRRNNTTFNDKTPTAICRGLFFQLSYKLDWTLAYPVALSHTDRPKKPTDPSFPDLDLDTILNGFITFNFDSLEEWERKSVMSVCLL